MEVDWLVDHSTRPSRFGTWNLIDWYVFWNQTGLECNDAETYVIFFIIG